MKFCPKSLTIITVFCLTVLPLAALAGADDCPWINFEFVPGTATPAPQSDVLLRRRMDDVSNRTGKIRIYGYLPEAAGKKQEVVSLFDARAKAVRERLAEFLFTHPGWILASERISDLQAPSKDFDSTLEVEFHGYDDPLVHAYDTIDYLPGMRTFDRVTIQYVRRSIPLYPAGKQEILAALGGRSPKDVFVRLTSHADAGEAADRGKRLSNQRLNLVVDFLLTLGIPEGNLLIAQPFGSAPLVEETGTAAHNRRVMVTFLEMDSRPSARPVRSLAMVSSPAPILTAPVEVRPNVGVNWQGQFGFGTSNRLFLANVSAEKRLFPNLSVGGYLSQVTLLEGVSFERKKLFIAGATGTAYLKETWEGPFARASLLTTFYTFQGTRGQFAFNPGFRGELGFAAQNGMPFIVRASLGAQYLAQSTLMSEVGAGGWCPTLNFELGFEW